MAQRRAHGDDLIAAWASLCCAQNPYVGDESRAKAAAFGARRADALALARGWAEREFARLYGRRVGGHVVVPELAAHGARLAHLTSVTTGGHFEADGAYVPPASAAEDASTASPELRTLAKCWCDAHPQAVAKAREIDDGLAADAFEDRYGGADEGEGEGGADEALAAAARFVAWWRAERAIDGADSAEAPWWRGAPMWAENVKRAGYVNVFFDILQHMCM